MSEENVVPMPTPRERLIMQMKVDLALCKEGRRDVKAGRLKWNAGVKALCVHLAQLRLMFSADIEFGRYLEANGFGKDVLNHQDRAAAVAMGQDPDALDTVLATTTRWSIQHIYANEFRFTHVSKPTDEEPEPQPEEDRFTHASKPTESDTVDQQQADMLSLIHI